MKNSKEYSDKLGRFLGGMKKKSKVPDLPEFNDPLETLIYGIICECMTEANAARVFKRIRSHFVDFNDLRVSRTEEILDVMDTVSPQAQQAAEMITRVLNEVYEKYDRMSLDVLKEGGKRQGRKELEDLQGISRFAVDYCFLIALGGHSIPLKESMTRLLLEEELIHPDSSEDEIHGFLERQINATDGWMFYNFLCGHCEEVSVSAANPSADGSTARRKTSKKKASGKRTSKK